MSEYERDFEPDEPNGDFEGVDPNKDTIDIEYDGKPFEINRGNTGLFTFIGANAMKNHVFIVFETISDGAERDAFCHVFEEFHEPIYVALENHMIRHDYPMHLNMLEISELDDEAFEKVLSQQFADLSDYVPEDFKLGTEDDDGKTAQD